MYQTTAREASLAAARSIMRGAAGKPLTKIVEKREKQGADEFAYCKAGP
jgi:hypothetical protein